MQMCLYSLFDVFFFSLSLSRSIANKFYEILGNFEDSLTIKRRAKLRENWWSPSRTAGAIQSGYDQA